MNTNNIHESKVHVIPSDISKEDNVVGLFAQIDHYLNGGIVDIVVNNAGINVAAATEDLSASDMEAVLGVNVVGAFLCAREAIKRMKKQRNDTGGGGGGGRIINIGSISASSPRPNSAAYTTSKFALLGLTKSLALDCRSDGISVGIIHPGNVVSALLSEEDIEVRGKTEGFLQAEDVAKCVLTMATLPDSANVLELTVIPTTQPLIGRG
jgi:NAD(P)-dependent dehydrogenase (short-subunit alcohol dehydrogenase family)